MKTKVYLVECYTGSTVTDEETENFVSGIFKTEEGAKKYVKKQINNWKIAKNMPEKEKETTNEIIIKYNHIQIEYRGEWISYYITEITPQD